jgi:hypothetical protein
MSSPPSQGDDAHAVPAQTPVDPIAGGLGADPRSSLTCTCASSLSEACGNDRTTRESLKGTGAIVTALFQCELGGEPQETLLNTRAQQSIVPRLDQILLRWIWGIFLVGHPNGTHGERAIGPSTPQVLPSTEQRLQCCKQKVPFCSDYYRRYWARTSDAQLVELGASVAHDALDGRSSPAGARC